jgi:hypothetical protein
MHAFVTFVGVREVVKDAGFIEVMDSMDDQEGKLPFVKVFAEAFLGVVLDDVSLFCNLGSREGDPF